MAQQILQLKEIIDACIDSIDYHGGQIKIDTFLTIAEFEQIKETDIGEGDRKIKTTYYARGEDTLSVLDLGNIISDIASKNNQKLKSYNFAIQTTEGLKPLENSIEKFYKDLCVMKDHEIIMQGLQEIYQGKKTQVETRLEKNQKVRDGIASAGIILGVGINIYTGPFISWITDVPIKYAGLKVGQHITNKLLNDPSIVQQLGHIEDKYSLIIAELEKRRPFATLPKEYRYGKEAMYNLI